MPQNMKSSDRFRTVSDSAVLCQLIPSPYWSRMLHGKTGIAKITETNRKWCKIGMNWHNWHNN